MGQTLTHGVYLPDEGERNCYNGLAANWSILDGAVGTIAEHTAALAGKAPAVHTHTKSDITDFPAYGTTAGTICEGNDSRLSDARTPVAHTHGKADITDLFNSANTWSKAQTYSDGNAIVIKNNGVEIGNEPSAYNEQRVVFTDKNGTGIASIKSENQLSSSNAFVNGLEFVVVDKFKNGVRDSTGTTVTNVFRMGLWNNGTKFIYNEGRWRTSHIPFVNNAVDIGSSSNQWRSVYAQNYYYNGTAWGLDKANVWTGNNTFTGRTSYIGIYDKFQTASFDVRTDPESTRGGDVFRFWSGTESAYGDYLGGVSFYQSTDGSLTLQLICFGYPVTGNAKQNRINFHSFRDGTTAFYPVQNNSTNLGTSTHKWKSLNGINPGALSLPNYNDTTYIDISGSIVPPNGETEINKNLGYNEYTPPIDGWLSIRCDGATFLQIYRNAYNCPGITSCDPSGAKLVVTLPVRKNVTYTIRIKTSGTTNLYQLYPCQGNV